MRRSYRRGIPSRMLGARPGRVLAAGGGVVPVVVNCRFLTRPVTGVERYAIEMVQALAAIRSDLMLVAPPTPPSQRDELGGLTVMTIGALSGHAWEQVSLPRRLRAMGEPLLLDPANTGPLGYRNQVAVIHDVTHHRHPDSHSRAFRWWYSAMTPRLVHRARGVATVSEFSKAEIAALYGRSDVAVTTNAVGDWVAGPRVRPARAGALEDTPFFLAVGSRAAHKDLATAYRAFDIYRAAGGTAMLAVVGASHRSFSSGQEDAAAPPPSEAVLDLGRVSDEELSWLYAHTHGFVFPSRYEGFGIPAIEAQAAGAPVIASDIPVFRETLAEGSALMFPAGNPVALAASMAELGDPRRSAALRAAGTRNARRYSWSSSASALSRLIDRLVTD